MKFVLLAIFSSVLIAANPTFFICYSRCPLHDQNDLCFKCSKLFQDSDLYQGNFEKLSVSKEKTDPKTVEKEANIMIASPIEKFIVDDQDLLSEEISSGARDHDSPDEFSVLAETTVATTSLSVSTNNVSETRTNKPNTASSSFEQKTDTPLGFYDLNSFGNAISKNPVSSIVNHNESVVTVNTATVENVELSNNTGFSQSSLEVCCACVDESLFTRRARSLYKPRGVLVSYRFLVILFSVCSLIGFGVFVSWKFFVRSRKLNLEKKLGRKDVTYKSKNEVYVTVQKVVFTCIFDRNIKIPTNFTQKLTECLKNQK